MSTVIDGALSLVWGTKGDSEIIVENIRETKDGDWEELPDGDGDIVAAVAHGTKGTVTMDFISKDGAAASYLLDRGATLTLPSGETHIASGKTLYVQSWERGKEKNGWLGGSLTAVYYPDMS